MIPIRSKNTYDTYLSELNKEIILECHICNSSSIFKNDKIVCEKCGYNKVIDENYKNSIALKLWFSLECCNEELWAYNLKHLNFLKEHVEATLRERNDVEYSNKSLGSRLPKWMTSKKNREEVLKAIDKLKK